MSDLLLVFLGIVITFVGIGVWAFWDYRHEVYWDEIYTGSKHHKFYETNEWKVTSPTTVRKTRSDKGKTRKPYTKRTK
jgi:hypothetical protein